MPPIIRFDTNDFGVLRFGSAGSGVAAWQAYLEKLGYDVTDRCGEYGASTENATRAFQLRQAITVDGIAGPQTFSNIGRLNPPIPERLPSAKLPKIPFVEARWYRKADRKCVDWIVIHCMDGSEAADKAETVAKRFAREHARKASYHYGVDCDSIVQCVREEDIAWHAPGANRYGIGIEHAGRARQTARQWMDDFGRRMLALSAQLVADISLRWNIPPVFVPADSLLAGLRGITTHAAVSEAFERSTHWDPGPGFPMRWYLDRVRECRTRISD